MGAEDSSLCIEPIDIAEEMWKLDANCQDTDTESFFDSNSGDGYNKTLLTAICNNCSVYNQCMDYAIRHNMEGWWANTTPKTRIGIRVGRLTAPPQG